ncbi:UNVERIFIED_CONTAM: hypothetical protein GTU68_013428 [Idotea baltica]|nr:hypothetical protein [Idotea baltica]
MASEHDSYIFKSSSYL